ncbi:hypothetical protein [Planctomyces sp. SH-PL14]|uniref:hypothetical protein n=1 Tax=Planctomyces sp. SH-PL14 TaxID=1632864 RepID=UPI00094674F6|nr:hypothetical protein [Planctomyces sp. SH-PL14]
MPLLVTVPSVDYKQTDQGLRLFSEEAIKPVGGWLMCSYNTWSVFVCLVCTSAAAQEPAARPTLKCFQQPPVTELALKWETRRCKWIALPGLTLKQDDASVETVAEHVYTSKGQVYRYNLAQRRLEALVVSNEDGSAAPMIALEATVIPEAKPSTRGGSVRCGRRRGIRLGRV